VRVRLHRPWVVVGCCWGRVQWLAVRASFLSHSHPASTSGTPLCCLTARLPSCPELLQILPRQNEKDPTRVDVEVMVREKPMQTADIEAEWGIAPGQRAPCLYPALYCWALLRVALPSQRSAC
jgi:hypothetical protein